MTGFRTTRTCSCGCTLWAFMREDVGFPLLVTVCPTCDLTVEGLTIGSSRATVELGPGSGSNDSSASAQNGGAQCA